MGRRGGSKKRGTQKRAKAVAAPSTSPIARVVPDHYGNTVIVTEETVLHAKGKHGFKADLDEITKVIQTPMRIRPTAVKYRANAYCFERMTDTTAEHLRIPVHYPLDADITAGATTGQAETIYPVDYTTRSAVGDPVYESADSVLPDPDLSR